MTAAAINTYLEDTMMKTWITEERLALVAALVVLIGVSSAAGDAFAQESPTITATAVAIDTIPDAALEIAAGGADL